MKPYTNVAYNNKPQNLLTMDAIEYQKQQIKEFKEAWEEYFPHTELEMGDDKILQYIEAYPTMYAAVNRVADYQAASQELSEFF